jgi:hypothetical protein
MGTPKLASMPLWRLLVAFDDAERCHGPKSPTVKALAEAVQNRLKLRETDQNADRPLELLAT